MAKATFSKCTEEEHEEARHAHHEICGRTRSDAKHWATPSVIWQFCKHGRFAKCVSWETLPRSMNPTGRKNDYFLLDEEFMKEGEAHVRKREECEHGREDFQEEGTDEKGPYAIFACQKCGKESRVKPTI